MLASDAQIYIVCTRSGCLLEFPLLYFLARRIMHINLIQLWNARKYARFIDEMRIVGCER